MKKVLIAIAIIGLIVSCGKKEKSVAKINQENLKKANTRDASIKAPPEIKFDKKVHDFGIVYAGDTVRHEFKLTNTGGSDLIISKAGATCGCTVPTWPKEPIAPGASNVVSVVFNTSGKSNKETKSVTLTTNTEAGRETLSITGFIKQKEKK